MNMNSTTAKAPAVIAPHTPVSSVSLVATNHVQLKRHPLNKKPIQGTLGLVTIRQALWERGFPRVSIFDPGCRSTPDIVRGRKRIVKRLRSMGAAESGAIVGISTSTDEYFKFPPLARLVREEFPYATIVAGGSHFLREEIEGLVDPVEEALTSGLCDAVQVGHARAFVDFIAEHAGRLDRADGSGFYRFDGKDVVGKGGGAYPHVSLVPYIFQPNAMKIMAMLGSTCRNGCDFCPAPRSRAPLFDPATVVDSLAGPIDTLRAGALQLHDPNPFEREGFDYYDEVFSALDERALTAKILYLDPAAMLDDDHILRMAKLSWERLGWFFFAGRDAVTEHSARAMGSRFKGRLKDQDQLDDERGAIGRFVRGLSCLHEQDPELKGAKRELTLSYILTPFDTKESAMAIPDDIEAMMELNDENMVVTAGVFPLLPYPGTRVRRRYAAHIDPDFDFGAARDGTVSPWKPDAGPAMGLIERLAAWERGTGVYQLVDYMRDHIDRTF